MLRLCRNERREQIGESIDEDHGPFPYRQDHGFPGNMDFMCRARRIDHQRAGLVLAIVVGLAVGKNEDVLVTIMHMARQRRAGLV